MVGKIVGRCRIEGRIGRGRTSLVYRAHHQALDATVAVKILLPEAAANPELVQKFETEARAIARIDNENVLRIYDVGSEGKLHYIVMELLEGEEVMDLIARDGRLEIMDALRITRQAANGLAAAHAREIVHRDVKPQNLFLLEDGTVKVVDFGLARTTEGAGQRVGTPHFMAPETCESGVSAVRSDIYSLGVVLYHLLVGQPPYAGQDVGEILRSHIKGKPLHPERKRPGLSRQVADLLRRMTARDPADRPVAKEVLEALDGIGGEALQEKGTLRRRRSRMRAHIAAGRRSSSAPIIWAVLLVVGIIIAIIAMSSGQGGNDEERAYVPSSPPPRSTPAPSRPPPVAPIPVPDAPSPIAIDLAEAKEKAAEDALAEVETWARANWTSLRDDGTVVAMYQQMNRAHPGTKAAAEASARAIQIGAGTLHAHPDKQWATADEMAEARKAWSAAEARVNELIRTHIYFTARSEVPEPVQDRVGQLGAELTFWKAFTHHLVRFQGKLAGLVEKLPEHRRKIDTEVGPGTVVSVSNQFFVTMVDGRRVNLRWSQVPVQQIHALARRAFPEDEQEYSLYLMAFAFAHCLHNSFFEADFDLGLTDEPYPQKDFLLREYKARLDQRCPPGSDRR